MKTFAIGFAAAVLVPTIAAADARSFAPGPAIARFGPVAVGRSTTLDPGTTFKVAFDVAEAAERDTLNRHLESAARFLNMHVAAGVPQENIAIAIVVHGGAAMDLVRDDRYGAANASAPLIAALVEAGVRIELCGQTAAYRDIDADDLLPGVALTLSAMTAHALLQQQGYTLNPF